MRNIFLSKSHTTYTDQKIFRTKGLGCARFYLENLGNDKDEKYGKELNMDVFTDDHNNPPKQCYQRCKYQSEDFTVTTAAYPSQNTFENRDEMCVVIKKLESICNDSIKFNIFKNFYSKQMDTFTNPTFCDLVKSQVNDEICDQNFTKPSPDKNVDDKLYKFVIIYTRDNVVKIKLFFRDPYYTKYVKDVSVSFNSYIGNTGGLLGLCTGMSLVSLFEIFYYLVKFLGTIQKKDHPSIASG